MTTIHHTPPPGAPPFAIYEDPEDQEPPSPSEVYEGDVSFNSEISLPGADDVIPSIETEDEHEESEPQPYRSSYTSRPPILSTSQSRRASGVTTTSFISSLPSEISISSKPAVPGNGVETRYTPRKERLPFRNPSSVRAMQMSSPPPLPAFETSRERLKGSYKLATPSKSGRSESVSTTGSRRPRSHRDSVHRESQAHQSPRHTPTPQQHLPLVLLHVTILPMQMPYAHELMVKVMPEWLVENYKILEEKLQDIVLMRRGLLIPHPREEYDVLEERILESLELKTPRLLKCGHFVGPEADIDDQGDDVEDVRSVTDDVTGRGSRMSGMSGGTVTAEEEAEWAYPTPEADDESICTDCHRQVKRPGKGVGRGTKRWDLKIYAANGLMRAGAWSAAWSEMERCDVEISPWIPEVVRKALEKRMEEEKEAMRRKQLYAAELQLQMEEEAARQRQLEQEAEAKRRADEAELQTRIEAEAAALQKKLEEEAAEKRRLEESLDEKIEEAKETIRLEFEAQALAEAHSVAERLRAMEEALKKEQEKSSPQPPPVSDIPAEERQARSVSRGRARCRSHQPHMDEIPLGTLLKNYVLLLLRDQRNFFILLLSVLVVFLSMNKTPDGSTRSSLSTVSDIPLPHLPDPTSSLVMTSSATTTATSISTLTVTQLRPARSDQSIPAQSSVAVPIDKSNLRISCSEDVISSIPESSAHVPFSTDSQSPCRTAEVVSHEADLSLASPSLSAPAITENAQPASGTASASVRPAQPEEILSPMQSDEAPSVSTSAAVAEALEADHISESPPQNAEGAVEDPLGSHEKDEL